MCLMRAVFVRILERYGQFRGTSRLLGTDGPFPGTVSLIREMSGLRQGAGGPNPRNAVPCTVKANTE